MISPPLQVVGNRTARLANLYRVPSGSAAFLEGIATGRAPPPVTLVGDIAFAPLTSLSVQITAPGALGTAVCTITGNGVPVGGVVTASVLNLGTGGSPSLGLGELRLYFSAGSYDTSNVYTWSAGTLAVASVAAPVFAAGLAPIDIYHSTTLVDSCLVRMHTTSLVSAPILTFPANPWDGQEVCIQDADHNFFTKNCVIAANASQHVENPYMPGVFSSGSYPLFVNGQTITYRWNAPLTAWEKTADTADATWPTVSATFALTPVTLTGRAYVRADSTGGAININMPNNPEGVDGLPVVVRDVGGAASTHAIQVTPVGGSWRLEIPGARGTFVAVGSPISIVTNWAGFSWVSDLSSSTWWLTP